MGNAQHPLITEWYQHERPATQRGTAGLIMGFPLWGEAYLRRFLDYMLPSIFAPANLATLQAHQAEMILYVDELAYRELDAVSMPLPMYLRVIPDSVMQVIYAEPGYKYTLLAAVHNLLIQQAVAKGAGFSMSTADIVYSERFFANLLRLGQTHDAIAHLALISTGADRDLTARRHGGVLALSARELGTLGWEHVAGSMGSWLMNDIATPDALPATHVLVWRGRDAVHIRCPHLTPVWLSAARCRTMPLELGDTLDAAGLYGAFYTPTVADDMTAIILDDTRNRPTGCVGLDVFKEGLRPFMSHMSQFRAPCVIPTLPCAKFLPDDDIAQRAAQVLQLLEV